MNRENNKKRNQKTENRIRRIGVLAAKKGPHKIPVKEEYTMKIYTFIPYIFYPNFDSLKTSLFSKVIV